jgi:hypothetical protein
MNLLMDAAKAGVAQTFLYELLDAYADPTGQTLSKHYGLFDFSNNPKPLATAIHDLTTILADTGKTAATFTAGNLNFTVKGMPTSGNSLEMEKSTGAYELVFWNEPTIWNATTHKEIAAVTSNLTVDLGAVYGEVKIFDPLTGTAAIADLHNVQKISLALTDHPLIIEVEPSAAIKTTAAVAAPMTSTSPTLDTLSLTSTAAKSLTAGTTISSGIVAPLIGMGGTNNSMAILMRV